MFRSQFDQIIEQILSQVPDTSDILFTVGKPVQAEQEGKLQDMHLDPDPGPMVPWQVESIVYCLLGRNLKLYKDLINCGSCDLSYEMKGQARFRVNIFSQRSSLSVAMRKLPMEIPSLEELNLSPIFEDMAKERYGLILVTGATGVGKSSSLAALLDLINSRERRHIITLEDPIEFMHQHKQSTVQQRELGIDFDHYPGGLWSALRQAPDVILVGEVRDRTTMTTILEAAETGHLVLGTLHTGDAAQTINRIVGMYDTSEEHFVRERLAESLKYIVSQRLVLKTGGGRIPALEILANNIRIRELVRHGEEGEKTFYNIIASSSSYGMCTFDDSLAHMFEQNLINKEMAMLHASQKSRLGRMINRIKTERGEKVTEIEGLELDEDYEKRLW